MLIVADQHFVDVTGDFRADHRDVATNIGIVGFFEKTPGAPPVHGVHTGEDQREQTRAGKQQAFKQGRLGLHHNRFESGHAGHGGLPG
ncbi:hypothetical protein D3C78_1803370 [compost metagenome]